MSAACRAFRLMVSGSAPLPAALFERWRALSGQPLLERYGMTELGMALSNPLGGPRVPGAVGGPLPGVQVRVVDEQGGDVPPNSAGELQVRGPALMLEYWRREAETRAAFVDGWFRTGDVAIVEGGVYRLLGRSSTDIIKTGGYKVSALEIEEVFRTHPAITDCAVVGLPDEEWGERVAMALVTAALDASPASDALRGWGKEHLAPAKVPTRYLVVDRTAPQRDGQGVQARGAGPVRGRRLRESERDGASVAILEILLAVVLGDRGELLRAPGLVLSGAATVVLVADVAGAVVEEAILAAMDSQVSARVTLTFGVRTTPDVLGGRHLRIPRRRRLQVRRNGGPMVRAVKDSNA